MQLRIENIGPVGSAVIDLTGLTVIGGMNDTGKSTIGKCLFVVIQAIRQKEQEYAAVLGNKVQNIASELIAEVRKVAGGKVSPTSLSFAMYRLRDVNRFNGEDGINALNNALNSVRESIVNELQRRPTRRPNSRVDQLSLEDEFQTGEETLASVNAIISTHFGRIAELIMTKKNPKEMYSDSFGHMLKALFRGEINNKRRDGVASITLVDNGDEILKSTFADNSLIDLHIEEESITALFEDATLLESPFILNFDDESTYFPHSTDNHYSGNYTTHDLLGKLKFATKESLSNNQLENEIADAISETITGRLYFDSEDEEFVFSSNDDIKVKITNTASGVKTLGIMQLLARAGVLTVTNLLIVDEPEVHLHPAWQLIYAKIIALLVSKYNVNCLVSSHSPYFLQALEAYTKIYKMENLTKYYLSEKTDGVCSFVDITADTEPLYKLLADPMKEIIYLQS